MEISNTRRCDTQLSGKLWKTITGFPEFLLFYSRWLCAGRHTERQGRLRRHCTRRLFWQPIRRAKAKQKIPPVHVRSPCNRYRRIRCGAGRRCIRSCQPLHYFSFTAEQDYFCEPRRLGIIRTPHNTGVLPNLHQPPIQHRPKKQMGRHTVCIELVKWDLTTFKKLSNLFAKTLLYSHAFALRINIVGITTAVMHNNEF